MSSSPRTPKQREARIYRRAAQLMERNALMAWDDSPIRFACFAIATVEYPEQNHDLCERMKPLFEHKEGSFALAWMDDGENENGSAIAINSRILALCFMAAMVEAGDA